MERGRGACVAEPGANTRPSSTAQLQSIDLNEDFDITVFAPSDEQNLEVKKKKIYINVRMI